VEQLPIPGEVNTRTQFASWVAALRRSLATELAGPHDTMRRSGGWENVTLGTFTEAMTAWLTDAGRLPVVALGAPIWSIMMLAPETPEPAPTDLDGYLAGIESWARSFLVSIPDQPWQLAADALRAGAAYE
jgi:hypothetical protein